MPFPPARPRSETLSQVFISYRHVQPDEDLAGGLDPFLRGQGLPVFVDRRIQVGLNWVEEIDRQLRASRFLVVFLSESSIRSDMVRQEVETAYKLRREGKMTILPVRVAFEGELPYDLASYLNSIQYVLWQPGAPPEELFAHLLAAIRGGTPLPGTPGMEEDAALLVLDRPVDPAEASGVPLPAADPRIVMETGTIRLDSPFYVRRREDGIVERQAMLPGSTVIVKGPRQSGKSSLLSRVHALARRQGRTSLYLDLQHFDESQLASLHSLLQAIAARIGRAVGAKVRPAEVWDADLLGDKASFASFLETVVLAGAGAPVVLLLDEVDRIFHHSYRADFFSAVRGWHNNRATEDLWLHLNLVLGHSTDPALWIENLNESPFNVGERLRLGDFTREQVADLNARHGLPLPEPADVDDLLLLVGGHPYLVRQALYFLATEGLSMAGLRRVAARDDGPFGDHLRRHLFALHQSDRLRNAVLRIVREGVCDDEALFQSLSAAGLVAGETRFAARPRCDLYREYLSRHL